MSRTTPASIALKALRIEVALLRPPLALADKAAARVGAEAVRTRLHQGLAVLDAVLDSVGSRLANDPSATPPPANATHAAPTDPAPRPAAVDPDAGELDEPGEAELVEQVAEELLEAQELAPLAGELAEDDELRRVQAELNAKRLVAEQQPPHD